MNLTWEVGSGPLAAFLGTKLTKRQKRALSRNELKAVPACTEGDAFPSQGKREQEGPQANTEQMTGNQKNF